MTIQVSTRIDETTKQKFDSICNAIGISSSNALSIFIKSVINNNGIPFALTAPQEPSSVMSREAMFGSMRGMFKVADDFNAPLDD